MAKKEMDQRIKDQLPTALLTLLSIVQALALELLWSHLSSTPSLYELHASAILEWLQMLATLMGVLLVWLIYCSMVMRFRWIPTTGDLIFPFFVGVLEFLLIEMLGVALLGPWLLTFAVIFGVMAWSSQGTYRRARQDPENASFFDVTNPAGRSDYILSGSIVGLLSAMGCAIWITGDQGVFTFVSVLVVLGALVYQTSLTAMFWRRSVFPEKTDQ